ncbi:hypothetical protein Ahy_A09g046647 isoform B [Arachis hypogaea]|uniref:Pentatricopeptide repeat-containing protein n=1 Tax=Arachis hypogaea TaxID=3818 RepID=A0A445BQJ7_ARAHY|nr:hypothetical protein Ahy_A09g046647 isoform B [Arachis hypogaea]
MESKSTYLAKLLQSCIASKALSSGKVLHARILRVGLFSDTFLSNNLVQLYSSCGDIVSAHQVFAKMPQRNIFSWNAILAAYCKNRNLQDACCLFLEMPERNTISLNTMISTMLRAGYERQALETYDLIMLQGCGRKNHGVAIKLGLDGNIYVVNALLSMYAKCGLSGDVIRVFDDIDEPNEVTFTTMMGGLAQMNQVKEALEMFRLMLQKGVHVDSVSLSSILGVCAKGGFDEKDIGLCNQSHGKQVHTLSIKLGLEGDIHLSNSKLDIYSKIGDMDSAEKVFANVSRHSVVSWNVMIAGYGNKCNSEKAVEYLQRMQCCGYEPDDVTYINMLAACVKSGDVKTGRDIFDSMPCPSLSSWNAILSAYSQNADHEEALKMFRKMQFQYQLPDRTTLAVFLSSSAELGLLEAGKQVHAASQKFGFYEDEYVSSGLINVYSKCGKMECSKNGCQVHAQIIKDGYEDDIFVGSSLIEMYCKCGNVDQARYFFDIMPSKNTVTWNEMIHGYAQNGYGDEAVSLYKDMITSGEKPDDITFVAVLTGCSHSALIDEGVEIFNSIQQRFGVVPKSDHYTCIIDCLGRAGRFQEVEVILDTMPCKDDPVVWEVVLSSCRIHTNLSLAKRAAEELFRLDPLNSASYVLLANISFPIWRLLFQLMCTSGGSGSSKLALQAASCPINSNVHLWQLQKMKHTNFQVHVYDEVKGTDSWDLKIWEKGN